MSLQNNFILRKISMETVKSDLGQFCGFHRNFFQINSDVVAVLNRHAYN